MAFLDEIDGDLITYWKTLTSITDLVGAGTAARIYPDYAKQGITGDHIIYVESDGESFRSLSGGSKIRTTTLDVYAMSSTRSGAAALSEVIRQATENKRGAMGSTYVHDVRATTPDSGIDRPDDGSYSARYYSRIVYEFTHAITAAN